MSIVSYKTIKGSDKAAHQLVIINDEDAGEIWREKAMVTVSKLTEPRRTAVKWRWFAQIKGESKILGRGDRIALILGPGFSTKDRAVDALTKALGASLGSNK